MTTEREVNHDEQNLVAEAATGDRDAMASLWRMNRRWIAAVVLAYKPVRVDLEDVLQEVAMTMVAKIDTLRDSSNVRAWLRAVAVNAARGAGRSEQVRSVVRTDGRNLDAVTSNGRLEQEFDDRDQYVISQVHQLPETYREPLLLRAVHGLRSRHIAEILDISEATVDTRISRARRMLRECVHEKRGVESITTCDSHVIGSMSHEG